METSERLFKMAHKFLGLKEIAGATHNPAIVAMLQLDAKWVEDDETSWCSAFVNYVAWLCDATERSKSLAARSWLLVGRSIPLSDAVRGDLVILTRGKPPQPDASVIKANGHVALYAGQDEASIQLLGANQGNAVSIASFPKSRILGIRRLT
jgi:uncharacterized protein (TIGR02594 family)